jgi:hypothetical protein
MYGALTLNFNKRRRLLVVAVVSLQHPAREESVAYYNATCGVFSLVILYVYIFDQ